MRKYEIHTYYFKNLDTGDSGEALSYSFWRVLKELGESKATGEGKYWLENVDTGNGGVYEIKNGKCKRISVLK